MLFFDVKNVSCLPSFLGLFLWVHYNLGDWLENVHKSKLRIGTYVNYKKLINYVIVDLGDIWLQKLTPQHVQTF